VVAGHKGFPGVITVVVMSVFARRWVVTGISVFSLFRMNVCDLWVVGFAFPYLQGL